MKSTAEELLSQTTFQDRAVGVILAAGKGTRMRSSLPKVLHQVAGVPILAHVAERAVEAGCIRLLIIVGHGGEAVREAAQGLLPEGIEADWVEQKEQLGTGHAVQQIAGHVDDRDHLLILSGDAPLIEVESLQSLLGAETAAMAAAEVNPPGSLGRVVQRADGRLNRIVEAADADADELAISTVNAGFYALPAGPLLAALATLGTDNQQGEIYLTDAVGVLADDLGVEVHTLADSSEAWGINDRRDLASVDRRWIERRLDALMQAGVTVYDPPSVRIEARVEVGADSVLHRGVVLTGNTTIGQNCEVGVGCVVHNTELADGASLGPYTVTDGAVLLAGAHAGPFARLRPGAVLGDGAKVGNFVEVKNSKLGVGVKAGHLAYLGDAEIGANANIGAGTVTCNYDGVKKSKTTIGEGAFIGSDTMLVAPVEVGPGAITGAGSTITHDVPEDALAVERSDQRTIDGWARRRRSQDRQSKGSRDHGHGIKDDKRKND